MRLSNVLPSILAFLSAKRLWAGGAVLLVIVPLAIWGAFYSKGRALVGVTGRLPAAEPNLSCVLYSPDGKWLAAGSAGGKVVLWDVATRVPLPMVQFTQQPITCLTTTPDGFLLAGTMTEKLLVWELRNRRAKKVPPLPAPITCIAAHPVKKLIAIGLNTGKISLLDTAQGVFSELPSGHSGSVKALAYPPDGSVLVSGGEDGNITPRDPQGKDVRTLEGHTSEVSCLRFSSDGRTLASADLNGSVIVWRAADSKLEQRIPHDDAVSCLGFTSEYLAPGSWDHRLRLWVIDSERLAAEFDTGDIVQGLSVHSDQRTIATVSAAPEVLFWKAP